MLLRAHNFGGRLFGFSMCGSHDEEKFSSHESLSANLKRCHYTTFLDQNHRRVEACKVGETTKRQTQRITTVSSD